MSKYINIHTHQHNANPESNIQLMNVMLHEPKSYPNELISLGWHPWFIKNHSLDEIEQELATKFLEKNVIAIGECGLDRAIESDFALQIQAFKIHLHFSKKNQKPLIIHCVKAYSDLLSVLKSEKYTGNLIIHDFKGNQHQVKELQKFNTWFSFGKSLFVQNSKQVEIIKSMPLSSIFLETDESKYPIEKIYLRAAEILSIEVNDLKLKLEENFKVVFGNELVR